MKHTGRVLWEFNIGRGSSWINGSGRTTIRPEREIGLSLAKSGTDKVKDTVWGKIRRAQALEAKWALSG
jgi:hypothetical protein